MKAWIARSPDIAALFNPAYCGTLLYAAAQAHAGQNYPPLPFNVSFTVLPLVLHEPSASHLPASIRTPLHTWVAAHPEMRIGLAERVREFAPLARESLMILLARGAIQFVDRAVVPVAGAVRLNTPQNAKFDHLRLAIRRAQLVGRLLAHAGRPAAIFASLGLQP